MYPIDLPLLSLPELQLATACRGTLMDLLSSSSSSLFRRSPISVASRMQRRSSREKPSGLDLTFSPCEADTLSRLGTTSKALCLSEPFTECWSSSSTYSTTCRVSTLKRPAAAGRSAAAGNLALPPPAEAEETHLPGLQRGVTCSFSATSATERAYLEPSNPVSHLRGLSELALWAAK